MSSFLFFITCLVLYTCWKAKNHWKGPESLKEIYEFADGVVPLGWCICSSTGYPGAPWLKGLEPSLTEGTKFQSLGGCKLLLTTSPNMYIYTAWWLRIQLLSYTAFWCNCPDVQQGMLTPLKGKKNRLQQNLPISIKSSLHLILYMKRTHQHGSKTTYGT